MPITNDSIVNILVSLIDPNPEQARIDYEPESLSELADSIAKVGLIYPIDVSQNGDRYMLIAGSRRLAACKLLQQEFIRAFIIDPSSGMGTATMLHENLFRCDISPYEEAVNFKKLIDSGEYDLIRLTHITNKPLNYIQARLRLLELPEELQTYVHQGKLPISSAIELGKINDTEQLLSYAKYAVETSANFQTIRYWRQQYESAKLIPHTDSNGVVVIPTTLQPPVFGWYCFVCKKHTEASRCQTIHICPECFVTLHQAVHSP